MEYVNFELQIGEGEGKEYPVSVVNSPAGEARETMLFPFDSLALQSCLKDLQIALLRSGGKRRRVLSPHAQAVQDFGQKLFKALMCGQLLSRYDVSMEKATQEGKGLRVNLRVQSPYLASLPWEFMYDNRRDEYLGLSRNTPLVRYLELPQTISSLTVKPPLRVLAMVASPSNLSSLDIDQEKQRIENAVAELQSQGTLELTWLGGQGWRDLQRAMRLGPWHIYHFIGHGSFDEQTDEGLIAFVNEDGRADLLTASQVGRLLANHGPLRLVLLNSCEGAKGSSQDIFSGTASIIVRRGIPAVVAMQYEITDRAAIEFARSFYESIADGLPVDAAVAEARAAISYAVNNTVEWGTPVLYMRSPDGMLFHIKSHTEEAPPDYFVETHTGSNMAIHERVALPPTLETAMRRQLKKEEINSTDLAALKSLDLSCTEITDAGLAHLRALTSLLSLYLRTTPITDAGLAHLKVLTGLQSLDLGYTNITDAGLSHLEALTNLQTLELEGTKITDAGLSHLEALTSLQSLELGYTKITDDGLSHLKALINLQTLGLGGTKITDAGLSHLKTLTNLDSLNLAFTKITDKGLSHLKTLTHLKFLKLWDRVDKEITDDGLFHLRTLTNLQSLYLREIEITNAGLSHLEVLTNLRFLDLNQTKITNGGLTHLKALTNLYSLNLGFTKITDEGLSHLKALTNLQKLNLEGTEITDAGLSRLKAFTNLESLDLNQTKITNGGLTHLKALTNLDSLNLRVTKITKAGLIHLQKELAIEIES